VDQQHHLREHHAQLTNIEQQENSEITSRTEIAQFGIVAPISTEISAEQHFNNRRFCPSGTF
jgi:hypothetical protein